MVITGDLTPALADALLDATVIAVDTETSGLSWAEDHLLLCQLFSPSIGPVLVRNFTRRPEQLARVFRSPRVRKVFHFAPFDLRFIESQWGMEVRNVACTKAASKILDPELPNSSHSLAQLTYRYLGVPLEKGAVRTSDWGAINLSDEQINYAVSDVIHLPGLLSALTERLRVARRLSTWKAVCRYMPVDARLQVHGTPNPLIY
ncbi:ribonuclease D [Promicromonospora sukumoe]|uniref:ribonuclease D n=1 Tax=Promicromonospora sukumoe TaxID=88382 RepID=UPI0037C9774A